MNINDKPQNNAIAISGVKKVALITGITGQDGSYLAELLLDKGYEVHGLMRRASSFNTQRLEHIFHNLTLHYGDLIDSTNLCTVVSKVRPDEVYNLAAQSHVQVSFEVPEYTAATSGLGTLRLLEAIRTAGLHKSCRFYQASTSEMFGDVLESPQNETTPFNPRSPYGCAKVFAYWIVRLYRDSYGMFAVNGILFNHESPRRGRTFVTRKVTLAVPNILAGKQSVLQLGNLDALRDWGHAKDYVEAMWRMLQTESPNDFCIASGVQISVREFCEVAFAFLGVKLRWEGKGVEEKGVCADTSKVYVIVNPRYFRPCEVETLLGDCSKAKRVLGWQPTTTLPELVYDMLKVDCAKVGVPIESYEDCRSGASVILNRTI